MSEETVLITGASSGLGAELAKLFAADGSALVLTARSEERLEQLAEELRRQHSADVLVVPCDLTDPEVPEKLANHLDQLDWAVDVLVNNAGLGMLGPFAEADLARQRNMIRLNVEALVHLTGLFLPAMIERGRGGVLNLGSTAGFQPGPRMAVYYATKAFVLSFSEALAEEVQGTGVTVTCLAPGPTRTRFGPRSGMDQTALYRLGAMRAETVARAGYRAFRRGRSLVVPGMRNKLTALSVRLMPRAAARKLVKWLQA